MIFSSSSSYTGLLLLAFSSLLCWYGTSVEAAVLHSSPATCTSASVEMRKVDRYHSDRSCNRARYNQYKCQMNRSRKYQQLKISRAAGMDLVPDMKTVICPEEEVNLQSKSYESGYDTMWIVENTATSPVVLAWVGSDGIEYSAPNTKITPAASDPKAILEPGAWRSLHTHEGHVFHVRELLDDGSAGDLLLQHRVGLVPIGTNHQDLACPIDDPEPLVNNTRDPNYKRTPSVHWKPCNTVDIGFRNMANCPLHAYWINPVGCQDVFKFHLGKDPAPQDFMWNWQSPTKYESSFIGNAFSFRSAANPDIVVDTYTMKPTYIIDCPSKKEKAKVTVHSDSILVPVGRFQTLPSALATNFTNATTARSTFYSNSTQSSAYRISANLASLY